MIGIDISNWQKYIDLSKGEKYFQFGIVKATEGIGYTDPSFNDHIKQLKDLNKLIGCYHFARPDLHSTISSMQDEAKWFIETVDNANILGESVLVLDWETEPIRKQELALAFIETVIALTGITPFTYASRSTLTSYLSNITKQYPIWMAVWPTINSQPIETAETWVKNNMASRDKINWNIWQFSASGKFPGMKDNIDLNYSDCTIEEWKLWCGYRESETELLSTDMKWAVKEGFFIGDGNGKYYPKDPLTREQAATLIRRMWDYWITWITSSSI